MQKQTLLEGKPLFIEGMISTKGTSFDANVQYNADKRFVEFLFDRNNNNQQSQNKQQSNQQNQSQSQEAPRTFRGKELTDEQYNKFKDGQTVYVELRYKKTNLIRVTSRSIKKTEKPILSFQINIRNV